MMHEYLDLNDRVKVIALRANRVLGLVVAKCKITANARHNGGLSSETVLFTNSEIVCMYTHSYMRRTRHVSGFLCRISFFVSALNFINKKT